MVFVGLLSMAVGGVLVYCAVENISVGDFFRGQFTKRDAHLSGDSASAGGSANGGAPGVANPATGGTPGATQQGRDAQTHFGGPAVS